MQGHAGLISNNPRRGSRKSRQQRGRVQLPDLLRSSALTPQGLNGEKVICQNLTRVATVDAYIAPRPTRLVR